VLLLLTDKKDLEIIYYECLVRLFEFLAFAQGHSLGMQHSITNKTCPQSSYGDHLDTGLGD
jgi:hypothetical protein